MKGLRAAASLLLALVAPPGIWAACLRLLETRPANLTAVALEIALAAVLGRLAPNVPVLVASAAVALVVKPIQWVAILPFVVALLGGFAWGRRREPKESAPSTPAPKKKRSLPRQVAVALGLWVLVLLAIEGVLRVHERVVYGSWVPVGQGLYTEGERGRLLVPGTDLAGIGMQIHVNALGFRGREVAVPKPAGVRRVVCVGGSTTFDAFAASDELAWPARLEAVLKKKFPEVEVVNAGVNAYSLEQSLARDFWEKVARAEPDVLVLFHAANDVRERAKAENPSPKKGPPPLVVRAQEVSLLAYRLFRLLEQALSKPEVPGTRELKDDGSAAFGKNVDEFVRRARELKAKPVLATVGFRWRPDQPREEQLKLAAGAFNEYGLSLEALNATIGRYDDAIARVASEQGCLKIPAAEQLSGNGSLFDDYIHFSPAGSQRMAEVVAEALEPVLSGR